jgi:hypothetical protein
MSTWKRITLTCLSLFVLGIAPIGAALAQVKVTAATPSSAYQGTVSLDVVVSGSGFDPSAKAQYFVTGTTNPGGITVTKVVFRKSTEIVTTIAVTDLAALANFDIQVTLDSGRKGKGTTLFLVKAKPTGPAETPTYPSPRHWQQFTSNGGTTSATSRLYMFGGDGSSGGVVGDILWSYSKAGSTGATWTYIPGGTSAPGPRHGAGWSCGAGMCVAANGVSTSLYKETWIFNESTLTWSQVGCSSRRVICPSARSFPAMAYDPVHGVHVMFGGEDGNWTALADTYTFNAATKAWRQMTGGIVPPARSAAAATYVPGVGVVMFGGSTNPCCVSYLNDMYVWNGAEWRPVTSTVVSDPPVAVPSIYGHSMAWDPARNALIVAKGVLNSWGQPSEDTWFVTFSNSGGSWHATWSLASGIGCQAAVSSPPDAVVHPGAPMAYDLVMGVQVFFGGRDPYTNQTFGNTVECL